MITGSRLVKNLDSDPTLKYTGANCTCRSEVIGKYYKRRTDGNGIRQINIQTEKRTERGKERFTKTKYIFEFVIIKFTITVI